MGKEKAKKEITIDELAVMVARGFGDVSKRFDEVDKRFDRIEFKIDKIEKRVVKIEKDIAWIKEILEKHTTSLRDLEQERIFTLSYVKRLEKEIDKIKTHLKIA